MNPAVTLLQVSNSNHFLRSWSRVVCSNSGKLRAPGSLRIPGRPRLGQFARAGGCCGPVGTFGGAENIQTDRSFATIIRYDHSLGSLAAITRGRFARAALWQSPGFLIRSDSVSTTLARIFAALLLVSTSLVAGCSILRERGAPPHGEAPFVVSVESVAALPDLTTNARGSGRDAGSTGRVGENVVWLFGDTFIGDEELICATAAWSTTQQPECCRQQAGGVSCETLKAASSGENG